MNLLKVDGEYMRRFAGTIAICILYALFFLVPGCEKKQPNLQPIYGGFCVGATWVGIDSGPGASLYFKDRNSKVTLIWPYLGTRGFPMLFTNDMAFLIPDMPDEQGRLGSGAFMAVQAPGPAVDISEDILKLWADANKLDFKSIQHYYSPIVLKNTNGVIEAYFVGGERFPNYPEAVYKMTWEQVSNIIQDVKQTGKPHTNKEPYVVYLKKDYDP